MKALNHKEITKKYLRFLLNFTVLIAVTVVCYFLYLKTDQQQSRMILEKKGEHDYIFSKRLELERKIDTLNTYLVMLTTDQVENEAALERRIGLIKNEAYQELERLKANGDPTPYLLYDKIISNVDHALNNKHALQQVMEEEELKRQQLEECMSAENRLRR